jgi:hypothetical protein
MPLDISPSSDFMKKFSKALPKKDFKGGNKGGNKKSALMEMMKKNKKK